MVAGVVTLAVLLIDQISKIWVKTNMYLGQDIEVFDWFIIHFTENPGMAFGMEFGGAYGKLALTLFRIVAVSAIAVYILRMCKKEVSVGMVISIALIFSGAIGNIIDSLFYGVIFSESRYEIATMFPPDGGYGSFFHGRVVDMLYFPIYNDELPSWVPIWGGEHFIFFRPVFNIADTAISFGVGLVLLNQKKFFNEDDKKAEVNPYQKSE